MGWPAKALAATKAAVTDARTSVLRILICLVGPGANCPKARGYLGIAGPGVHRTKVLHDAWNTGSGYLAFAGFTGGGAAGAAGSFWGCPAGAGSGMRTSSHVCVRVVPKCSAMGATSWVRL